CRYPSTLDTGRPARLNTSFSVRPTGGTESLTLSHGVRERYEEEAAAARQAGDLARAFLKSPACRHGSTRICTVDDSPENVAVTVAMPAAIPLMRPVYGAES